MHTLVDTHTYVYICDHFTDICKMFLYAFLCDFLWDLSWKQTDTISALSKTKQNKTDVLNV